MTPPVLNRGLVLEAPVSVPDGAGGQITTWSALGTLWGELKPRSGRETNGEAGPLSTARYRITVRAAPPGQTRRSPLFSSDSSDDLTSRYIACGPT